MPQNDKVDRLIREDVPQVRKDHPALVEQLRRYEDDWRKYKPLVKRSQAPAAKRAYRSA